MKWMGGLAALAAKLLKLGNRLKAQNEMHSYQGSSNKSQKCK